MAPLRFAANLAWMFQEQPTLPQRIEAAARAGFRAAELGFPYSCSASELRAAAERAGLELVLLNTPPGTPPPNRCSLSRSLALLSPWEPPTFLPEDPAPTPRRY